MAELGRRRRPVPDLRPQLIHGDLNEDNILIAAAVTASLEAIVTRNVADFSHAPIPVWEPAELLKRLAGGGSPPTTGASAAPVPP